MRLPVFKIVTQDDGSTDLVDQLFVLARLFPQSSVNHRLMSQDRGETLVVVFDGNLRLMFAPTIDELLHSCHILTWLSVRLTWLTDDNPLNWFTTDVIQQKVIQFRRRNSRQSARNNLKRIGDCYTSAFLAVVNRKYSHTSLLPTDYFGYSPFVYLL